MATPKEKIMNLTGKKVLLTGGSGFLGRVILRKLKERGAVVYAPRSTMMDLMDTINTKVVLRCEKPEIVIHSAAYYGGLGVNGTYPADIFFRNTLMYANVLEASKEFGVKKVVMIGTACSYPDGLDILREEDLWEGPVHKSVQNYGSVKKMMQIGIESYKKQYNMDGIHILLANLYGEWDSYNPERSHVVAALIRKFVEAKINYSAEVNVWGSGRPIREFLYVGDAAEGIVQATERYNDIEPLNIGTGVGTPIIDLTTYIALITGYKGDIVWNTSQPDGQYKKIFDISKMKAILDWEPETKLADGLRGTIEWFEENYKKAIERW